MNAELLRRLTAHARWLAARHPTDLTTVARKAVPRLRVRAGNTDIAAIGATLLAAVVAVAVAAVPAISDQAAPPPAAQSHQQPPPAEESPSADNGEPPTTSPGASRSPSPTRTKPSSSSRSSSRPAPFVLRAQRVDEDAVQLTWEPPGPGVTGYEVWRSGRLFTRLHANTTEYRMGKLRDGDYEFYVVAVGDGTTRRSNTVSVTIDGRRPSHPNGP